MSLSTRSYSKESRYSRSSSYHASANQSSSSSYRHRTLGDVRPLSTRLIERDSSCPSLAWNWNWDDPFLFDRFPRWRFDDDFWKWNFGLGRPIPIYHRSWNSSSTSRVVPIQYSPSSVSINRRKISYKKSQNSNDSSSSFVNRPDENSMSK